MRAYNACITRSNSLYLVMSIAHVFLFFHPSCLTKTRGFSFMETLSTAKPLHYIQGFSFIQDFDLPCPLSCSTVHSPNGQFHGQT